MSHRWCFVLASVLLVPAAAWAAEPEAFGPLEAEFNRDVRPLVSAHCLKCHSTEEQEGTLDLEQFAKLADVRAVKTWLKVAEMLDNGEMPPKDVPQPAPEHRKRLRGWVAAYLRAEAFASARRPGPVVLRRLNNAEYTYTLRDLTGVDLQPAREFPVDGAAGEGFTNTGNALVMSPALADEIPRRRQEDRRPRRAAARRVPVLGGRHAVAMDRRGAGRIRSFYARFTDSGGGTQVNLQGIVFGTNQGGRLPLEHYLEATIADRELPASGRKTIARWRRQA